MVDLKALAELNPLREGLELCSSEVLTPLPSTLWFSPLSPRPQISPYPSMGADSPTLWFSLSDLTGADPLPLPFGSPSQTSWALTPLPLPFGSPLSLLPTLWFSPLPTPYPLVPSLRPYGR